MKITNEYLKKELEDIINCIVKFDHTETLEVKGRYFDIIQKDLKKLVKNNGVLNDVSNSTVKVCKVCKTKNLHYYPKTNSWTCAFC